jgi:hypothetical protein
MNPTYSVRLEDYADSSAYSKTEPPTFETLEHAKRYAECLREEHFPSRDRWTIKIEMETIHV